MLVLEVDRPSVFGWKCGPLEAIDVRFSDGERIRRQLVIEQVRHQTEIEQLGVRGPVRVLLELDPWAPRCTIGAPHEASETF